MHNSFPKDERYHFEDSWKCWLCGMNTATAMHHIVGRGTPHSKVESSILNAAWLCNYKCHIQIHGALRSRENMSMLLEKTKKFLEMVGYKWTTIDNEFYDKYKHYYSTPVSSGD